MMQEDRSEPGRGEAAHRRLLHDAYVEAESDLTRALDLLEEQRVSSNELYGIGQEYDAENAELKERITELESLVGAPFCKLKTCGARTGGACDTGYCACHHGHHECECVGER